jgi:trans-2,3-dihydro-3-hydroxyanthranilate isomerase
MGRYRYLHLDVFTDRRFAGNQLAVFPEARGLETSLMQRVANEMAFSESTFVFPADAGGDVRMRIFTPGTELPMAGHPTVGSAFALAHEGRIDASHARLVFELNVGLTPVDLEWADHGLAFAWMRQQRPSFGRIEADRAGAARALGLSVGDLVEALPVEEVSCGVPFLVVPLRSRAAVDQATADARQLASLARASQMPDRPVFLFTLDPGEDEATAYCRMFAPGFGIAEDPATGSAGGPLGCYLVRHGVVEPARAGRILISQGVKMGRPSVMHASIEAEGPAIVGVRVGGQAVIVGEGTLEV